MLGHFWVYKNVLKITYKNQKWGITEDQLKKYCYLPKPNCIIPNENYLLILFYLKTFYNLPITYIFKNITSNDFCIL